MSIDKKHLVLVSKPVYMGFYVAVNASDPTDAVTKVKAIMNDETESGKIGDIFDEMRVAAHAAVAGDGGFVNDESSTSLTSSLHYHEGLDMDGVLTADNKDFDRRNAVADFTEKGQTA